MSTQQETIQDKGIIIVPLIVLEKIDRNRDRLSRAEFIEFCVNALLKQGEVCGIEPRGKRPLTADIKAEEAVSREEFEGFKKGIKNLQRAYIDLLVNLVFEPLSKASVEEQEHFKQRVAELLRV